MTFVAWVQSHYTQIDREDHKEIAMSSLPTKIEKLETPFCQHAQSKVVIETTLVYPIDLLPDPPRVAKTACSHFYECILLDKSACPEHII